jgi:hypothetical protein
MSPRTASTPCVTLPSIRSKHSLAAVVLPELPVIAKAQALLERLA